MKSTLLITLMGVTIGTLSAVNASAQVPTRLVMTVPFDFQIHEKTMPAGEYSLRTDNRILYITCEAQPKLSQIVLTTATAHKGDRPARAIFQRSGDRYYLSQVFAGPQQAAWELPPSRRVRARRAVRGPDASPRMSSPAALRH